MLLTDPNQVETIILLTHFSIFTFPASMPFPEKLPHSIPVYPNEKGVITIDQVREIPALLRGKPAVPTIIAFYQAEALAAPAQSCLLKLLEEPGENRHFAFFTHNPKNLLPTIHSRAHSFQLCLATKISDPPAIDPEIIDLAKQYLSASPRALVALSATLTKDKDKSKVRAKTLLMLDAAIELLYKSYFKTGSTKFLPKLQKLLTTYDAIAKNGHIRLQLVAGAL